MPLPSGTASAPDMRRTNSQTLQRKSVPASNQASGPRIEAARARHGANRCSMTDVIGF
jgi:hypothetical protein